MLRNYQGKQCCLGFDAIARGATPRQILLASSPSTLCAYTPSLKRNLRGLIVKDLAFQARNSMVCIILMQTNDDDAITDAKREKKLKKLGKKAGIKFVFKP